MRTTNGNYRHEWDGNKHSTCNLEFSILRGTRVKIKENIYWGYLPKIPTAFDPVLAGARALISPPCARTGKEWIPGPSIEKTWLS